MKDVKFDLDGLTIYLPVSDTVYANFQNQFCSKKSTPLGKNRYKTLEALLRYAYKEGIDHGRKRNI